MEVIGRSVVGIYDGKEHDGKRYYFLAPGEVFDLATRKRVDPKPKSAAEPGARTTKGIERFLTATRWN
jgi:hypothetical protein